MSVLSSLPQQLAGRLGPQLSRLPKLPRLDPARLQDARATPVREHGAAAVERWRRRTSWLSGNAWIALCGAVLGIALGANQGWAELRILGFTCLGVLLFALAWTLGRSSFEVSFDLYQPRVTAGDTASGRVLLRNRGRRTLFPTRIELAVGNGRAHFMLPSLGQDDVHEQLFDVPTRRRCVIDIGPVRSVRTDPLHLLRRTQRWSDTATLYVHPVTVALTTESIGFVRDIEGVTTQDLSSSDVSFHALREYQPGDDRRAIHWRTTARVGKLMVRQFEETRRARLLIVLPTSLADYADEADFESAISVAGSLARNAMSEEREVSIFTTDGELAFSGGPLLLDRLAELLPAQHQLTMRDLAARAIAAVPHASVCTIIAGEPTDPRDLRGAHKTLPLSVSTVALRVSHVRTLVRRRIGDLTVLDLPDIGSLARAPSGSAVSAFTSTGGLSGLTGSTTSGWWSRAVRRRSVDLTVIAVLLLVGVQAFGPVFGGAAGYLAAGGGAALGMGLGFLSWRRAWTKIGTLSAGIVAYLLVGGPIALPSTTIGHLIPTLETLHRLVLLSYQAWRDLLTVSLPAGLFDGPAVVPLTTSLVCATLATSFALRLRHAAWAMLPCLTLLVVGILWGSHEAPLASLQGLVFAATGLGWIGWRAQVRPDTDEVHFVGARDVRASRLHQVALAAGSLAAAVALAGGLVTVLGGEPHRHVLRDDVVPPLNLEDYASPLTLYRHLETTTKPLLTVTGLPAGARLRLAAMDVYDGNVYNVSDTSARFARVGRTVEPSQFSVSTPVHHVRVVDDGYDGPWVPGGGDLRGLKFRGARSETESRGLFYNPGSGTVLSTAGLGRGSDWTADLTLPPAYGAEAKAAFPSTAKLGRIAMGGSVQPQVIGTATPALIGDASTPMDQLRAMENTFKTKGTYANGTADPSLSGHTVGRLNQLLSAPSGQMVGDDEQYAVAMALVARSLGMPARVVMGFYPSAAQASVHTVTLTGDDAHVWVEVLFAKYGWVPFDPTPDKNQRPNQQTPQPQTRNDPQVLPPPEVPDPRKLQAPPQADSDQTKHKPNPKPHTAEGSAVLLYAAAGAGGVGLASLPFVAIVGVKALRRRRRRLLPSTSDRASGGWAEVSDMAADLGVRFSRQATRTESATLLTTTYPSVDPLPLARLADAQVFGDSEPSVQQVDELWVNVSNIRAALLRAAGFRRRWLSRISVRSLVQPTRLRHHAPRPIRRVGALASKGRTA